jgi:archaellin
VTIIRGHYTDRGGRPATGIITLIPEHGGPVTIRVQSGVLDRTNVPAGVYEVTASLRSNAGSGAIEFHPATFTIRPGTRETTLTGVPTLVHPTTGPQLSIVETEPGVYKVTGP